MIEQLIAGLEGAGYECFVPLEKKSCFDLAARRGDKLLLIKAFSNIDSFREEQATALTALASALGATPLVVGEKSKAYRLEPGLVYDRHGISTVSKETLAAMLGGTLPRKRFYKGRVVAEINAEPLGDASASELARELHVTREAIYSYRHGSRVEYEKAEQLERLVNAPLIKDINLLSVPERGKVVLTGYLREMGKLGFDVAPVHRGFDALARAKETLLMDAERSEAYAKRKAGFMTKAGDFFNSQPVIVMKSQRSEISGVPVIREEEIRHAESPEGLVDLVKKRRK